MIIYYNPRQGPQEQQETAPNQRGSPSAARSTQNLPPPNGPELHDQRTFPFSIWDRPIEFLKSHPILTPLSYLFPSFFSYEKQFVIHDTFTNTSHFQ